MSKTILMLTSEYPPGPGGIGTHAFNLCEGLKKNGFAVEVVTEKRLEFAGTSTEDHVHYVTRIPFFYWIKFYFVAAYYILRRPDIVIVSGVKSLPLSMVTRFLGISSLVILHGHELLMGSIILRRLLARFIFNTSRIVAVSEFAKEQSQVLLKNKSITVIPNGVHCQSQMDFKALNPQPDLEILTVGTVSKRKGQANVIRCMPDLLAVYPALKYRIVGMVREPEILDDVVRHPQVNNHVIISGVVSAEVLREYYRNASVFVMLSENQPSGDVEGFGIAILEANSFGTPAIGSRGTGIEQAIRHGHSGILIDAKDANQLIEAIRTIANNYERFSRNALKWAAEHDWSVIAGRYVSILNELPAIS